jgi:hypothetical protein
VDSPGSLSGHATGLRLVGESLLLLVLLDLTLGVGAGSCDDVGHILVWDASRTLFPCGGKRT